MWIYRPSCIIFIFLISWIYCCLLCRFWLRLVIHLPCCFTCLPTRGVKKTETYDIWDNYLVHFYAPATSIEASYFGKCLLIVFNSLQGVQKCLNPTSPKQARKSESKRTSELDVEHGRFVLAREQEIKLTKMVLVLTLGPYCLKNC